MLLLSISVSSTLSSASYKSPEASDSYQARKGDLVLTVLGPEGNPIPGASVSYTEATRDFLFGLPAQSLDFLWPYIRETKVNYLEVYATWNLTEDPGYVGFLNYEFTPSGLNNTGFTLSDHCFIWFVADPTAYNLPTSVKSLSYDQLKANMYNHVYLTVQRFKSIFSWWDINEPFWPYDDPFHLTSDQWMEILNISVRAIKTADPKAKIYLNFVPGDYPKWNYYPIQSLKRVVASGLDFDAIGLEWYGTPAASPGVPLDANGYPELTWVSQKMDEYAEFGKPLILTEVDVSANAGERAQADWLSRMYQMAFAKPYVEGISWSTAFDATWLPGAGIFDCKQWRASECLSATHRLAYYALKNFTTSMFTNGNGTTDTQGRLQFNGFGGNYTIQITAPGFETFQNVVRIKERSMNQIEVKMRKPSVTTNSTVVRSTSVTSKQISSEVNLFSPWTASMVTVSIIAIATVAVVVAIMSKRRHH